MSDFRTDYDYELRAYNERLREAAGLVVGEHVLDVGCGAGQSTRDAARAVAPGRVLGIDLSAPLLDRARQATAQERLDNVRYVQADAQVHPFAAGEYDVAISRFGVMFFAAPVAALRNVAHALRPGGRLVLLVWQRREDNTWVTAVDHALGRTVAPGAALDAFSLGDPTATRRLLEAAGLHDIHLDDIREPVYYGRDTDSAMAWVQGFSTTQDALARLPPDEADAALARLRATLDAHLDPDAGVVLDARAWMITARVSSS
ncbi:MAG TPA: methyltransferase domain-containing protein [Baekduia sp.]|jgi:ubiquinone/menaquinone biosynthesis C-methylase UbiE